MKTPADLCYFIEGHVTYKPGYRLSAWVDGETLTLNMVASGMPDSTGTIRHNEGDTFSIAYTRRYDARMLLDNEERLLTVLRGFFTGFEAHERDEWFKVDGKPVRNPHKKDT